jgi:hypothetical protein
MGVVKSEMVCITTINRGCPFKLHELFSVCLYLTHCLRWV